MMGGWKESSTGADSGLIEIGAEEWDTEAMAIIFEHTSSTMAPGSPRR